MSEKWTPPWQDGPLKDWAIVGMNHYHVNGQRRLFVAMTRDRQCITAEGEDDQYLWNRLCHKAWDLGPGQRRTVMSNTALRGEGWSIQRRTDVRDCGCLDEIRAFTRPGVHITATGTTGAGTESRLASQLRDLARAATEAADALDKGERDV